MVDVECQNCGHKFSEHRDPDADGVPTKCLLCEQEGEHCPGWVHIAAGTGRAHGQASSGKKKD